MTKTVKIALLNTLGTQEFDNENLIGWLSILITAIICNIDSDWHDEYPRKGRSLRLVD